MWTLRSSSWRKCASNLTVRLEWVTYSSGHLTGGWTCSSVRFLVSELDVLFCVDKFFVLSFLLVSSFIVSDVTQCTRLICCVICSRCKRSRSVIIWRVQTYTITDHIPAYCTRDRSVGIRRIIGEDYFSLDARFAEYLLLCDVIDFTFCECEEYDLSNLKIIDMIRKLRRLEFLMYITSREKMRHMFCDDFGHRRVKTNKIFESCGTFQVS